MMSTEAMAREMYMAYGAVTDNKNYQGLPMPTWDALPEKIQTAWVAAAEKAREILTAGMKDGQEEQLR